MPNVCNLRDVQYELRALLRAHAAPACEKPLHRDLPAHLKSDSRGSHFTDGNRAHFRFDLPLDTRFKLHRTMRKPEVHQRQPGGRVAQWLYRGNFSGKRDRVGQCGAGR